MKTKVIKDNCYKGTRVLVGNTKRDIINSCISGVLKPKEFQEINIPIIQKSELFKDKVGDENNNMMYTLTDRGNRDLCLSPEYTAIIQKLTETVYKQSSDVKLFYLGECFRGEKPQQGRYRQFTQLGVEVLNPVNFTMETLKSMALKLCSIINPDYIYELHNGVSRGLDYYEEGKGFEIVVEELGSSKQVCGGGKYTNGYGFAIGLDRILNFN